MATKLLKTILLFSSTFIFLLFPSRAFAWDLLTGGDHEGQDWHISSNTTVAGTHTNVGQFTIDAGVTLTVQGYNGTTYGRFELEADSISISGTLNADNKGYRTSEGPGSGRSVGTWNSAGGGSYGGLGGWGSTVYGSAFAPNDMGSSGGLLWGTPGYGGGFIKLISSGDILLEGVVTADGGNCTANDQTSGGGAGGGIYISANSITGTGSITANGGNGRSAQTISGNGGGGRIYLEYTGNMTLPAGNITTIPGVGGGGGTLGTVVYQSNGDLRVMNSQTWYANPTREGSIQTYDEVFIGNGATLSLKGYYTNDSDGVGFVFNVNDFYIEEGATLSANSGGYQYHAGIGKGGDGGSWNPGGGGSYGGVGGDSQAGIKYGSASEPIDLGSSGGRGYSSNGMPGGGAIKIVATNSIAVNGNLTANGGGGASGVQPGSGGSGGSIWLVTDTITGLETSLISANGGNGRNGGQNTSANGGGGRIAIYYTSTNTFLGTVSVAQGTGGTGGTAGSLVVFPSPTSLSQYSSDGLTLVNEGDLYSSTEIKLKMNISHFENPSTLNSKVEIRDVGTDFTGVATHTVENLVYSGTDINVEMDITGLADLTSYHWQAQVCDQDNLCSAWVSYGNNNESEADFTIQLNVEPNLPDQLAGLNILNGDWTRDSTPSLVFNLSDPDESESIKYQIQVDDDLDFSSPVLDYTSAFGSEGEHTFTVGQLVEGGTYAIGEEGVVLGDGAYYWRVKAMDDSGASTEYVIANSGEIAFKVDSTMPTGSVYINLSSESTSQKGVSLSFISLDGGSGVTSLMVCEIQTFTGCTWGIYESTKSYTLSNGDGEKKIYVKFRDLAGNESLTFFDSILLDTTGPTGSIKINNGASTTSAVKTTLSIYAQDANSEVLDMKVCTNSTFQGCDWEQYKTLKDFTLSYGNGSKTVYIQFRDSLGNISETYFDKIILNIPAPVVETPEPEPEEPIVTPAPEPKTITQEEVEKVKEIVETVEQSGSVQEKEGVIIKVGGSEVKTSEQKKIHVYKNSEVSLELPVGSLTDIEIENGDNIEGVYAVLGEEVIKLTLNTITQKYVGLLKANDLEGEHSIDILTIFKDGSALKNTLGISVDPYGYIYSLNEDGNQVRIKDAVVTLYKIEGSNRSIYFSTDQDNPQFTNEKGEYSFFVEPGTYVLTVEAEGYVDYDSGEFEVEKATIEMNIELEEKTDILEYAIYLLGVIPVAIIGYAVFKPKK